VIVDLPSTTTKDISKRLVRLRQDVGSMALSRVLTLVLVVDEQHAEAAIQVANDASHQHPCRIVAVVTGNKRGASRLDAQIRVGGDAGASEVVVLRLYGPLTRHASSVVTPLLLPDSPVVAWWPADAPRRISEDSVGAMAQRRITDAALARNPRAEMKHRAETYAPGDTDLAWTRITLWRGLLAAALDQPPFEPVLAATVTGGSDSPSADLLAAWLAHYLKCPVTRARSRAGTGIVSVRLERRTGNIDLVRPDGDTATLMQPGQPDRTISLPHRSDAECLADELRRLDPDEVYEDVMTKGMPRLGSPSKGKTASEAIAGGEAPSVAEAERTLKRLRRTARIESRSAMVEAAPEPQGRSDTATVKKAAARKLAGAKAERGTGDGTKAKGAAATGGAGKGDGEAGAAS
jgi:glucose-6-phosphate dehydrogenase assembly protein OpcA